jgi:ribonuclease R
MKRKRTRRGIPRGVEQAVQRVHIPSRKALLDYISAAKGPRSQQHIAEHFAVTDADELEALASRLRAMERDGQIVRNRRGGYGAVAEMDLVVGRVIGHPDGFGFLQRDEGGDDVFLSAREMRSLLHDDRAMVRLTGIDRRGRPEGALVEVLERANHEVVGRLWVEGGIGFVVPDNKRIHQDVLVPDYRRSGAVSGQIVVAEILEQPDRHHQPVGRIKEILGDALAPGMEVDIAIRAYELPLMFPDDVLEQARQLPDEVRDSDKRDRRDLTDKPFVTIDGVDARDFDDAVYCQESKNGWRLFVAIADVSHYVTAHTPLDHEALKRGNSVYFPDRVLPMLPEALSNELCSLRPQVERLAVVCELELGPRGKMRSYRFYRALIRSAARLTYDQVWSWLSNAESVPAQVSELLPHLQRLHKLDQILYRSRRQRGAIDLDTIESRIRLDDRGRVVDVIAVERNEAHRLIEECMLAANVAAAEFMLSHEVAGPFRIHETPAEEKITDLRTFLGELGLKLEGGKEPEPKHFLKLLDQARGRDDFHLVQTVVLRTQRLAIYSEQNKGHFGLAYPAYAHFTSPIRRYPDLMVHRAVCALAKSGRKKPPYSIDEARSAAEHCSMTDRRAEEATRDAIARLKCAFMFDKIGEQFEGVVSAVTGFGLFVELKGVYVEGLVHVTELPNDYYHFDPVSHTLSGGRAGRVFRLGNHVTVRLVRVDTDERKIDLQLVDGGDSRKRRRRG